MILPGFGPAPIGPQPIRSGDRQVGQIFRNEITLGGASPGSLSPLDETGSGRPRFGNQTPRCGVR